MGILDSVKAIPCHPKNRGGTRPASAIRYLVFHYTANDGDWAVNNVRYYQNNVVKASAHYFVDDRNIYQSVEDLGIAWAVGGKKWNDCGKTGGGSLFLTANNYNTISIELCDTRRDGNVMATEATLKRAAELGRALMEKYDIPIERVIRHFDVNGKHCPAYFMDNKAWEKFKERLGEKEENMTGKEIYDKLQEYLGEQKLPEWAKKEFQEAVELGITDGNNPMQMIPRYQAAIMAKRARVKEA